MVQNTAKQADSLHYRKERKFVVEEVGLNVVESIVKSHPAMFSRAYPPRHVNNIYFDTPKFQNLNDNVIGSANRYKFRIRWYGPQLGFIEKPVMEIKIKKGLAGSKMHFPLAPFTLKRGISQTQIEEILSESVLPDEMRAILETLSPTLLNRYHRKYFHSANRKFRITLDHQLSFTRISRYQNYFLRRIINKDKIVLELKYDVAHDEEAGWISNNFPFRLSKNSKYVNGVTNLDVW